MQPPRVGGTSPFSVESGMGEESMPEVTKWRSTDVSMRWSRRESDGDTMMVAIGIRRCEQVLEICRRWTWSLNSCGREQKEVSGLPPGFLTLASPLWTCSD